LLFAAAALGGCGAASAAGVAEFDLGEVVVVTATRETGTQQDQWYVQASASYLDQDYFRLPDDFDTARGEDGGRRDNSRNSDRKYNLKLGYTPNETDEYSLNLIDQHGEKGTPPYAGSVTGVNPRYWQWPYWDKQSVYYISNTAIGAHQLKLRIFHDTF